MEEEVIKLKCPGCSGKIAIDQPYYLELQGTDISCPHCAQSIRIPPVSQLPEHTATAPDDLRRTQKLQLIPVDIRTAVPPAKSEEKKCPGCGAKVGARDRICISCETPLTPDP